MKCPVCKHGDMAKGEDTLTLERGSSIVVFKNVPAMVCDNCGEKYIDSDTTKEIMHEAEYILKDGGVVDIRSYSKSVA